MEIFEQQLADAKRSRQEALGGIDKINLGAPFPSGIKMYSKKTA